jgi:DNA-binding transcriptional ArsR family regulator
MVKRREAHLDLIFSALSDATRRAILTRLERGEASVSELAAPFAVSMPAISKQLSVLEKAGLVERRNHHCRLRPRPLSAAQKWLDRYRRFWEHNLDSLDQYLNEQQP